MYRGAKAIGAVCSERVGTYLLIESPGAFVLSINTDCIHCYWQCSLGALVSSVTMAELVYGARLPEDNPSVISAVRAFLARILISFLRFADALVVTPVTKDIAIKALVIDSLKIVSW